MTDGPDGKGPSLSRRASLEAGGALVFGGVLAGCTGRTDGGAKGTNGSTDSGTRATGSATGSTTPGGGSYSVSMAPMGEVTFDGVPKRIFTRLTHLAGMAFALGRGADVTAMHSPAYYDALWNQFTPRLDGVSVDWSGLYSSWNPSKEQLYELDNDVHLADPAGVASLDGWTTDDVDEIAENVGPWFGNYYSDRHATPPDEWADEYRYYGLWEMFEKVAQVFRENARYEALAAVHTRLRETIADGLPPSGRRPTAAMALPRDLDEIYVYKVTTPGFLTAHTRSLGPAEAFGGDVASGDTVDIEGLLEADPDVLFGLGGMHPETDMQGVRRRLREDPVGKRLSAVENDRVYAQGARYQGPILNLFQLEMTAKQLYPDQFGEWPRYTKGPYPELPADEQLFDRKRVANVVEGSFRR